MLLLKNVAPNLFLKGNWRKRQSMAQRWAGVHPGGWQQVLAHRAAPSPWKGCSVQPHAYRCCKEPENNGINPKSSNSMWLLLDYMDSLGKRKKKKKPKYLGIFLAEQVWCTFTSEFQKALCRCCGKSQQGLRVPAETRLCTHDWQTLVAKEEAMQITADWFHRSITLKRQHISVSYNSSPAWLLGHQG